MQDAPMDILACFVMRGGGAPQFVRNEARAQGDVVFLDAPENLPREVGPLVMLRLWFAHALQAFPGARFVGKADSDVYFDLPRVARQLAALPRSPVGGGGWVWGRFESYHLIPATGEYVDFSYMPTPSSCGLSTLPPRAGGARPRAAPTSFTLSLRAGSATGPRAAPSGAEPVLLKVGPFAFPKGPLMIVERTLVRAMSESDDLISETDALISRRMRLHTGQEEPSPVWEDIWLGYALARTAGACESTARGCVSMRLADIGRVGYWEQGFRRKAANKTVLWHFRYKHRRQADALFRQTHAFARAARKTHLGGDSDAELPQYGVACPHAPVKTCALVRSGWASADELARVSSGNGSFVRRRPRTSALACAIVYDK